MEKHYLLYNVVSGLKGTHLKINKNRMYSPFPFYKQKKHRFFFLCDSKTADYDENNFNAIKSLFTLRGQRAKTENLKKKMFSKY